MTSAIAPTESTESAATDVTSEEAVPAQAGPVEAEANIWVPGGTPDETPEGTSEDTAEVSEPIAEDARAFGVYA
ncbi:hypothetical protein ACWFRM_42815, partial [Streptomyces sp. NPDC055144]